MILPSNERRKALIKHLQLEVEHTPYDLYTCLYMQNMAIDLRDWYEYQLKEYSGGIEGAFPFSSLAQLNSTTSRQERIKFLRQLHDQLD